MLRNAIATLSENSSFVPLLQNSHLQTVLAHLWPSRLPRFAQPTEKRLFNTATDVRVLAHVNRAAHAAGRRPAVVVIVHGLTGSSRSFDCRRMARRALEGGYDAVRLNIRNCGGTENLCSTLYHSGLTDDLREVVNQSKDADVYILGYSIGGNIALKLAGEWGENPPAHLRAVAAVSPPIDLAASARALGEPRNRFYERRFLRRLERIVRRKAAAWPGRFSLSPLGRLRSIVDFDHAYTAPAFGFKDAWDYYARASAAPLLARVRVPSLVIAAQDDPFIPYSVYGACADNREFIRLVGTRRGGHTGFLARSAPFFWAEAQAVSFFNGVRALHRSKPAGGA